MAAERQAKRINIADSVYLVGFGVTVTGWWGHSTNHNDFRGAKYQ